MTVYVESNFIIEIALGQEQSEAANDILQRANQGEFRLAIPSFSLSEPFSTITTRGRNRGHLIRQINEQLRDLERSTPHQHDAETLAPAREVLARIDRRERNLLSATVGRLLDVASILPLDASVFQRALEFAALYDLSSQDAIILASVVRDLEANPKTSLHYFFNRNWKDFTAPALLRQLDALGCTLIRSFIEGASRLDEPAPG